MNYERIVGESFKIAFKKPSLWIFGMLAGGAGLNIHFRQQDFSRRAFDMDPQQVLDFLIPFFGAIMLLAVLSLVVSAISTTGLIEAVNHLVRGGNYRFGECFSRGVELFWRMLVLELLEVIPLVIAFTLMVIIAVAVSPITLVLTIPAMLVFVFVWLGIIVLAKRAAVIRDIGFGEAVEEGMYLFRSRWQQCFAMGAIAIGIGIIIAIIGLAIALLVYFPINSFVERMFSDNISVLFMAALLALPFSFLFGGIAGTLSANLGTLFYLGLVEPGREHRLEEIPPLVGDGSGPYSG